MVLRGVAQRQLEVTLLGDQTLSMPIGISPTALHKYAHPDGEAATARGEHTIVSQSDPRKFVVEIYWMIRRNTEVEDEVISWGDVGVLSSDW